MDTSYNNNQDNNSTQSQGRQELIPLPTLVYTNQSPASHNKPIVKRADNG